jgi:hypothetical protein
MMRMAMLGAVLAGVALASPVWAKKPAAADEAAVRMMVERVYIPYSKPNSDHPENPDAETDAFDMGRTQSLSKLETRWDDLMEKTGELYGMNGFDWYCQCQDYDTATARIVSQSYTQLDQDGIDVNVLFSPGRFDGKDSGSPLHFRFRREDGLWKLDDLTFEDGSTLREGLAVDIEDATKDLATSKAK